MRAIVSFRRCRNRLVVRHGPVCVLGEGLRLMTLRHGAVPRHRQMYKVLSNMVIIVLSVSYLCWSNVRSLSEIVFVSCCIAVAVTVSAVSGVCKLRSVSAGRGPGRM